MSVRRRSLHRRYARARRRAASVPDLRLCTDDVNDGWVVRVTATLTLPDRKVRVPAYWHGPIGGNPTGSSRLTPDVAVFSKPEVARQAMVAAGWQPGRDRDHVIAPVSQIRAAERAAADAARAASADEQLRLL